MDQIKTSFQKVKQDMDSMKEEINFLKQSLAKNIETFTEMNKTIKDLTLQLSKINVNEKIDTSTNNPQNPTNPTHSPTDSLPLKPLKGQNMGISIGNEGVPTDRQTNQQTDTSDQSLSHFQFHPDQNTHSNDRIGQIQRVSEVLESLDSIKKEVRTNFKKLTGQEMAVFSSIYTLEEQGFVVDYSLISEKLGLSESSIRDYVNKITKKGIPLIKSKENNKRVILSISSELKKIASLQTILSLRKI